MLEAGDEVLVPEPCYVAYKPCISFAGGLPAPEVFPERIEEGIARLGDVLRRRLGPSAAREP